MKDDSELKEIKKFFKSEISMLGHEVSHYSKYSPKFYHKNVPLSRKMEKRSLGIILKNIEKVNKKIIK